MTTKIVHSSTIESRFYRFNLFIGKKSDEEGRSTAEIREELRQRLGISTYHLSKVINLKATQGRGYLSVRQLITAAHYFQCGLQDLISDQVACHPTGSGAETSSAASPVFTKNNSSK